MVILISSQSNSYKNPQDVKVGDTLYRNVSSHDLRDIVDNDGVRKEVNFLEGDRSRIVSYVIDNKVVRADEYYYTPETMQLGDKVYTGVNTKVTIPGKYSTYTVASSTSVENKVRVRNNGAVLDIGQLRKKVFMRKLKQPFIRMAQALC